MQDFHTPQGSLVHQLLMRRPDTGLFDRFTYAEALPDDQVEVRWFGTAGFSLTYRGAVLLIDPFITRPSVRKTLSRPLVSDEAALARWVPRADVIACGHSHHDHILDVPAIARRTGAMVLGSRSSCNLCRAYGVGEEQLRELCAPATVSHGPFCVTVLPSRHGRALLNRVPLEGSIPPGLRGPLRMRAFRTDETFALKVVVSEGDRRVTFVQLSSADFTDETFMGEHCDVLMPCIVGRHRRPGYTAALLSLLQPKVVVPHHYDDFFLPLGTPLRELPRADLAGFQREVRGARVPCRIVTPYRLETIRFTLDGDVVE
ncbi:MAG: MBL fold metallo-hydrolase [Deltaproteobacteria bacterium]|nr:MBL fold metallo-hydrolase [Deltaproteobacteria bacterium]